MKRTLGVAALVAFVSSGAGAQNLQLSSNPLLESISVEEMIALMKEFDFSAAQLEDEEELIVEVSANGGKFYIELKQCEGDGDAARCKQLEPYGYFDGAGVTLNMINDFNINKSVLSSAGLVKSGKGMLIADIYLNHGVTKKNCLYELATFLNDIDTILEAVEPGPLARVDWAGANRADRDRPRKWVNRTGRDGPTFVNASVRRALEAGGS